MNGIKMSVVFIVCILIISSTSLLGNKYTASDEITDSTNISIPIDTTVFYDIPQGKVLQSVSIAEHEFTITVEPKPVQCFITTDKEINLHSTNLIYDEPFNYEVLKEGKQDVMRCYAPRMFYQSGEKFETEKLVLTLFFSTEEIMPTETTYDPQDGNPEYIIITNETLWDTFNSNFKQWKITNDDKINNVLIINVSDIISSNYWVNGSYGDATNTTSGNHWIPNGEEVTSSFSLFNDTQAHIRNFIRFAYDTYTTRYVLLGGNKDVVPPRMICSRASGDGCNTFHNDLSHASDMYYSCLDYCMNNNTNSYWMENECCGYEWDTVDWGFDLMVGRVPVNTVNELNLWINKTKEYVNGMSQGNYLKNVIVACKDNGNAISNQTWTIIEPYLPSSISVVNGQNITQAQWSIMDDYCNGDVPPWNGIHILYHEGHGGTLWTPYQPSNLNNKLVPNYLDTEGCHSGDFGTDTTSRMEQWMTDDGGPFAGIANSASGWFIASTYFSASLLYHLFNNTDQTNCFCEANNKCRETTGHTEADGVFAMIYKERNFFGDPSLEIQEHEDINYNVTSGVPSSCIAYGRKLVRTSNGDLHCVYYLNKSDVRNIYCSKSTDDGLTWTQTQLTNYSQYNQTYPTIGVDSNNNLHVTWYGDYGGQKQIRYIKYDGSWSSVINLTTDTSYWQYRPRIIIDDNDVIHVVWYGVYSGSNTYSIRYVNYTTQWNNLINLTNDNYNQSHPCIEIDKDNNVHIAWRGEVEWNDRDQIQYINHTISGWGTIQNITNNSELTVDDLKRPRIMSDNNGNIHMTWTRVNNTDNFFQAQYFNLSTGTIQNITTGSIFSAHESMSVDEQNILHLCWYGTYTGQSNWSIRYKNLTGTDWGATINLTSWSTNQSTPQMLRNRFPSFNKPLSGYSLLYYEISNNTIRFQSSEDLQWRDTVPQFISIDNGLNGTYVYSSTPTYNWSKPDRDVSQYNLQIDNNADFSSPEVNITDINQYFYPSHYSENATRVSFTLPNPISNYDVYYCRVDAFVKEVI